MFVTENVLVFVFIITWHLANKSCRKGSFFLLVLFMCEVLKHWQRIRAFLLMQVAKWGWCLLNDQDSFSGLRCSVKDDHLKRKKQKQTPPVQMRGWINPSVLSFHVEVMLSKSFGTRLPGWRRDGWMSGVDIRVPVQLVEPNILAFRNYIPSFACWMPDQSWRSRLEWFQGSSWGLHQSEKRRYYR